MRSLLFLALLPLAACSVAQPDATSAMAPPVAAAAPQVATARVERPVIRIRNLRGMTDKVDRDVRKELERALRARGIRVTPRPTGWTHELRGRFTSLNEANATSVTYIYDLQPAGGGRSIRITGFERAAGSSSDPWGGVDQALAQRMAERSAERIVAKLR